MTTNELYGVKENCTGCAACYSICPVNAISMLQDNEGFLYPAINERKCINCNKCINICPIYKEHHKPFSVRPLLFAVKNKDTDVRIQSSSGGVFSLFAEYILSNKGCVFGAIIDDFCQVIHTSADVQKDYVKMRGSKYVQSEIGNTYKQCKENLEKDKLVLFSGTPCQIAGLNAYLGSYYDNLLTIDLICHGVNSPLIYFEWLNTIPKGIDKKSVNFRDKAFGWQNFCISFKKNGNTYMTKKALVFLRLFFTNLILRPACYNCKFATQDRIADITLGDFWGIDNFFPKMNDDLGVSCVLSNTKKGKFFLDKILNFSYHEICSLENYVPFQPALYKSVERPHDRDKFWLDYSRDGFRRTSKKYVGMDIVSRFIRLLKRKFLSIQ